MIRAALVAALLAGLSFVAGCQVRPCKAGTILVSLTFAGAATDADVVELSMANGVEPPSKGSVAHAAGQKSGSIEIDFAIGYHEAMSTTLTLTAKKGGAVVATRKVNLTLAKGCSHVEATLGSDGPPKTQGQACDPLNDTCATGFCVDGVCCDTACEGQCQACDVSGSEGTCAPATGTPRGTRATCTGDGTMCGGTCDGTTVDACVYPTTQCRPPSCAAGTQHDAASCAMGTCPADTTHACAAGECAGDACASVVEVAAGSQHTCALWSNGAVYCWGGNGNEQLGQGAGNTTASDKPLKVPMAAPATHISASQEGHTCAITVDKNVQCWGYDNAGQLGRGTNVGQNGKPEYVVEFNGATTRLANAVSISTGNEHTCAILGDGRSACWGLNIEGEGGSGTSPGGAQPFPTLTCPVGSAAGACGTPGNNYVSVGSGVYHSCWVTTGGAVACSGLNSNGSIGQPVATGSTRNPINVTLPGGYLAVRISTRGHTNCFVAGSSAVLCFGANDGGQCGRTPATAQPAPLEVCNELACTNRLSDAAQVSMGGPTFNGSFGCALIKTGGAVRCWGKNDLGQLGDGTIVDKPFAAAPAIMGASFMSAGGGHVCAVTGAETIQCWGKDDAGQLGDADAAHANKKSPVTVKW